MPRKKSKTLNADKNIAVIKNLTVDKKKGNIILFMSNFKNN